MLLSLFRVALIAMIMCFALWYCSRMQGCTLRFCINAAKPISCRFNCYDNVFCTLVLFLGAGMNPGPKLSFHHFISSNMVVRPMFTWTYHD